MILYMSPFKQYLPRACPLQHYSVIAYISSASNSPEAAIEGLHASQDALCFLTSSKHQPVSGFGGRSYLKGDTYRHILNLNLSDGAFAL